jgi:asparagine synthase (glutamine-hydrolysing)
MLRSPLTSALSGHRPELRESGVPFGLARLVGGAHIFDRASRTQLLRDPGWVRPGIRRMSLEPLYREVTSDPINEILHVYLRGRMAEDSLPRAGAATGLAGVGLREPLLDRDLVSWCARLPGHWKVRRKPLEGAISKWPLREILRPILGRALVGRPKRVLPGPWRAWLGEAAADFHRERVAQLKEDRFKLFLPGALDGLFGSLDQPGTESKIWTLFFLDAWLRSVGAG